MSKLIQNNPYYYTNSLRRDAWAEGFTAGQKSTLTPVSVTGRWWQSRSGKVLFAGTDEYESIQRAINNSPDLYLWLSDEETREF